MPVEADEQVARDREDRGLALRGVHAHEHEGVRVQVVVAVDGLLGAGRVGRRRADVIVADHQDRLRGARPAPASGTVESSGLPPEREVRGDRADDADRGRPRSRPSCRRRSPRSRAEAAQRAGSPRGRRAGERGRDVTLARAMEPTHQRPTIDSSAAALRVSRAPHGLPSRIIVTTLHRKVRTERRVAARARDGLIVAHPAAWRCRFTNAVARAMWSAARPAAARARAAQVDATTRR